MLKLTNTWINGDCIKELAKLPDESVDMIMTSPPFMDVRVYSNDPCDISNCESKEEYYYMMGLVIKECERVLKPGGKFVIEFEDYNYTKGRDGKIGQESLTGGINQLFLDNGFSLYTKTIWEKYTAQRAMIANGKLYYKASSARDMILAANTGFVYVYKKAGEVPMIRATDITLQEWATWASGVWKIPNSGIGHTTPFAEELCHRCIKLWSCPGDVILDPFAGAGTVNFAAIKAHRSAIGIELNKEFYDIANEKRFSTFTDADYEVDDSVEQMVERFKEQLEIGKEQSEAAKAAKEEKKQLTDQKKKLQAQIKSLENELNVLGLKKSEIKKIRDSAKLDI